MKISQKCGNYVIYFVADPRLALVFDVVTYLISRFISGTRIVDHSVPELVQNKFEELMNNLSALLSEFGKALISKEHVRSLKKITRKISQNIRLIS